MKGLTGTTVVQRAKFLKNRELNKDLEYNPTLEIPDYSSYTER